MKKMLKMQCNGELFELCHYPILYNRKETDQQRAARQEETTRAKKIINRRESRMTFMRTAQANYRSGRDLKVELRFCQQIPEKTARRLLDRFHAIRRERYADEWKRLPPDEKRRRHRQEDDGKYRWMCVLEDHTKAGEPCAVHFHLLMTRNPNHRKNALDAIMADWARACGDLAGSVCVRTLEGSEVFQDTAKYFLKQRREKGRKKWTKSRNNRPPRPPVYQRIAERDVPDEPPGCKALDGNVTFNEFGTYGWMVCRVVDRRRFLRWWHRQEAKNIVKK